MPSADAAAMSEWVTAVARELGLTEADSLGTVDLVLDLTADERAAGVPGLQALVVVGVGEQAAAATGTLPLEVGAPPVAGDGDVPGVVAVADRVAGIAAG